MRENIDAEYQAICGASRDSGGYDAATLEFCELVDCHPSEVLDREEARRGVDVSAEAQLYQSPKPESMEVYFGRHRGKTLGEVPIGYLRWLASDKFKPRGAQGTMRKFKKAAKQILKRK